MTRRSRTLARIAIAAAAALLAAETLRTGLATQLGGRAPLLAARVAPGNARIAVAAARAALARGEDVRGAAVSGLAMAALRRDTTLPAAIELRALALDARGERNRARRLFHLSDSISRRSLPTRLWLIQQSVDRGDVAGALANFDLALRTSTDAPDVLFPVLAGAASDPGLVEPIARMLDRPSDWRIMFLHHAITEANAARDIAKVVLAMRDREALRGQVDEALVARLVGIGEFRLARRVNDLFRPGGRSEDRVSDADFANPGLRYPFGWALSAGGEAWAARDRVNGRAALIYRASPHGEGQVARQLLTLDPGRYRLWARAAGDSPASKSPSLWTLSCAGGAAAEIARLEQPARGGSVGSVDVAVPPGCAGQWLTLALAPSGEPGARSGSVATVGIEKL